MTRLEGVDETYLARDRGGLANLLVGAGSPSVSFDELVEFFKTIPFDELVGLYAAGEWWDREGEPGVRAFHQLVRDGTMPYPVVDCLEDGIGCLLLTDTHTYTSIPQSIQEALALVAGHYPNLDLGRTPALNSSQPHEVEQRVEDYVRTRPNFLEQYHRAVKCGTWAHVRLPDRDGDMVLAWENYSGFILQRGGEPVILFGKCLSVSSANTDFFAEVVGEMMKLLVLEDHLTRRYPAMLQNLRKTRVVRIGNGTITLLPEDDCPEVRGNQVLLSGFAGALAIIKALQRRLEEGEW